jgi:hypothetical protein
VVMPKANGKLRMCVDYTSLNKACAKDPYPLPRLDQIVDSTSGCELLSFIDTYSGFHQILMAEEHEEKTALLLLMAFITICPCLMVSNMPSPRLLELLQKLSTMMCVILLRCMLMTKWSRLGSYWGLVPRVPRDAGYGPSS